MADNKQIAADVLEAIGGRENVRSVQHCMTRLRFNLVDASVVDDEAVKAVRGAMGVAKQGGQYQVVIGTNVPEVYGEIISLAGLAAEKAVDENLDAVDEKAPFTPKAVLDNVLNYLSGSVVPLIPVLVGGARHRTRIPPNCRAHPRARGRRPVQDVRGRLRTHALESCFRGFALHLPLQHGV